MESLHRNLSSIRVPISQDKVHKDECVYSYDNPNTDTGLYVSLTTFLGFGKDYVEEYYRKTNNAVFLHIKQTKTEIPREKTEEGPEKKITRLAIGVEGGFEPDLGKPKYEYEQFYKIVIFPNHEELNYPDDALPLQVTNSVKAIIGAESVISKLETEALHGTWDGEVRQTSKFAENLLQLDNGIKIPPSGWKCEKCDLTNNLWLNLTDGSILCGRRFFDGSGGNEHAAQHYQECQYPLAVKLGTITADGKGDVYSYAEDDMVEDPKLIQHLEHFGIKIKQLEKTEKSMIELELNMNSRIGEWSILTESSSKLEPICGPGYTGMRNLGNSCYMNSVMQVMFTIPDFIRRFYEKSNDVFNTYPADPINDFNVQMCKLGVGLLSGKYSSIVDNTIDMESSTGISPIMFKNLIGKNHPDFSSKMQQDAQEYFLHLINVLDRNSRHQENPADALKFSVEERVECRASGKVKYTTRDEWCLSLPIPLHCTTNITEIQEYEARLAEAKSKGLKLEPDDIVRPSLSIDECFKSFSQPEEIEHFFSSAINEQTTALKTTRIATMPDYLLIHLKKITLLEDWTSLKLDVAVKIPDTIDLSDLRAKGLQPNEELLPDLIIKPPTPPMDLNVFEELVNMGFPPEACKRAIFFSQNTGLENATQWIMEHITDANFSEPFVPPGTSGSSGFIPNASGIQMLMNMGFTNVQATKALQETNNNIERAADWIFSHQDVLDAIDFETSSDNVEAPPRQEKKNRDGINKYKLVAFISHMGKSAHVGHYVCHILKNEQWVIFNDAKVAISQNPPKELGYLYLFKRE